MAKAAAEKARAEEEARKQGVWVWDQAAGAWAIPQPGAGPEAGAAAAASGQTPQPPQTPPPQAAMGGGPQPAQPPASGPVPKGSPTERASPY